MANIDQEIIEQKIEGLPEDLRELISNEENALVLEAIGKKHGLYIDKIGELVEETGLVMLGISHPRDFIGVLEKKLGVSREKAVQIAKDVNQQIFSKVRESLKKIHNIEGKENSKFQVPNSKTETAPPESLPTKEAAVEKPPSPFENKLTEEIHQMPKETKEIGEETVKKIEEQKKSYSGGKDPYKEPLE